MASPTIANGTSNAPSSFKRRPFWSQWIIGVVAFIGTAFCHAQNTNPTQASSVYRFSPVNQYGLELTARYWNPIIDYVSQKAGVKLELKVGRTSADTTAYVLANEVDFVFSNHLFSPEREALGWKVFGRRATPPIHSQIVVLADSPIQKLEQLKDLPVAFPGPEALVAYKFAYAQLLQRQIPVQVVFGGNMDGAFAQLLSGKVKAVGANSQLTEGWVQREGKAIRIVWQSDPLHDLALMASKNVPKKDLLAISKAFTEMLKDPVGKTILAHASELVKLPPGSQFVASTGTEYASYRKFYQTAPPNLR
ncbi:phosphate/phosphite/phosphonate ABC transporter substrate-binding protein [Undibacterium fentianense]|uniref:Phosphate/phosphite/phosphonate ABC transporter substrate-binding protein n=1 Tax=Undibacterium fentianense TaxID=2828728 RepID=A0A941IEN4_9BURK|nr:PhnD/SsuA/transferrin family substrate-binding protein [Undibacterium fentianense]MBR7799816.1 phosphate/phosphite/phosphonate ABC transporter substrate-binding protein [Undibacterium fentianense]